MIWPEHAILLKPPKEFFTHPRVERGLAGLSPHVCNSILMAGLQEGWQGNRFPLNKAGLIRYASTDSLRLKRESSWYVREDGSAVKGCVSRRAGAMTHTVASAISINQSLSNRWTCHLTRTTDPETKLSTAYVELEWSPTTAWQNARFDWRDEAKYTPWEDTTGRLVKQIIIPFTFASDEWKVPRHISGGSSYDCPVYGVRKEYEGKIIRCNLRIDECQRRLDEMDSGRPHRPDMFSTVDHTWTAGKVRRLLKLSERSKRTAEERYAPQLERVADSQAKINQIVHDRAWKAALLGSLQAAELTIKQGDHDQ